MTEILSAEPYAIVTESGRPSAPVRVLKDGQSFAVFDLHGDVTPAPESQHGFYYAGTRFLSGFELQLYDRQPVLLSSTVSDDNVIFTSDLTNLDVVHDGRLVLPRGVLHIFRSRVLQSGSWTECLRVTNHGLARLRVPLCVRFEADFADIFEVRGTRRGRRGRMTARAAGAEAVLCYLGLDGVERRTHLRSPRSPDLVTDRALFFRLNVEPHAHEELELTVSCEIDQESRPVRRFADVVVERRRRIAAERERACTVVTSNHAFNRWLDRSTAYLQMMITETPYGRYPYAGIPWFSTPFGRDGIITALELLWAAPDIAKGVLSFLAKTQATAKDDARDAQPGKIIHETREGEMATLGEVPFGRYYGSADATPLFVVLAHAYYDRTGDLPFVEALWPHLRAALEWMDRDGDPDGDGFIEYARRSATGLVQQGWKDSFDSVFHTDGTIASPPIALCEIQSYAYAAWSGAAALASVRGEEGEAARWRERAERLQRRFEEAFWCDDLSTYALALDVDKRPCRVPTSNPGHCLFMGIASRDRARAVSDMLLAGPSFGGWGIRTVNVGAARYNPMSYHNGSVWPHDNALAAAGFSRYGLRSAALRVFSALFDLSQTVDMHRLPELICGFQRRPGEGPTLYPVACAPQAWAAGVVYLLVQASLGLRVDATARRLHIGHPALPESVEWLRIQNLAVHDARVDLLFSRHGYGVGVAVLHREGDLDILVTK